MVRLACARWQSFPALDGIFLPTGRILSLLWGENSFALLFDLFLPVFGSCSHWAKKPPKNHDTSRRYLTICGDTRLVGEDGGVSELASDQTASSQKSQPRMQPWRRCIINILPRRHPTNVPRPVKIKKEVLFMACKNGVVDFFFFHFSRKAQRVVALYWWVFYVMLSDCDLVMVWVFPLLSPKTNSVE